MHNTVDTEDKHLDHLEKVLGSTTFNDFETTRTGDLIIAGITFSMRIGLYLNRPTQVIMAEGRYVKMRAAPEYDEFELAPLNPSKPEEFWYSKPEKKAPRAK